MTTKNNNNLLEFDEKLRKKHGNFIIGIDEVGRGSVAGPIVAGAVCFSPNTVIPDLNDSKSLTEKLREQIYEEIISKALVYCTEFIYPEEIDEKGLTWANKECMKRAALKIKNQIGEASLFIIDASPLNSFLVPQIMFKKADNISQSVAGASIIAKVERDHYMKEVLDKKYPGYDFANSKGYIGPKHKAAIKQLGLIKGVHRFSYHLKFPKEFSQISILDLKPRG